MRTLGFLFGLWLTWAAWGGVCAFAADEPVDVERVVQDLRAENPDLTEAEARELADLAAADLAGREGREWTGRGTGEAGIITQGPPALGAPELGGGGPAPEMTPEERAIAERVGVRAQELAGQGLSEKEVDAALRQEFEKEWSGHEGMEHSKEQMEHYRGEMEGHSRDAVEHSSREAERTTHEREQPATRETVEVERPTVEVERTTHERPSEGETPRY